MVRRLMPSLSLKKLASSSQSPPSPPPDVPKGSMAVYVGEENKRFVIPISYLKHPFFQPLLHKSEEEFGLRCDGAIHLPCAVAEFYALLRRIHSQQQHEEEQQLRFKYPRGPIGIAVL